ncbi:hypothetical protein OSB04_002500 [Centaurea solstitialis]|uniref:Uncharacterized protein n=1 Tax=Centaurea solstitialis TaxID=347529 RepID=A0AA38TTH8_9ASTR|nr:hypothetical protein OSB04_002500 [Centaurea solstitialis]
MVMVVVVGRSSSFVGVNLLKNWLSLAWSCKNIGAKRRIKRERNDTVARATVATTSEMRAIVALSGPLNFWLLHRDLCRHVNVESMARKKYTLVIVDKYTKYISFVKRMEVLNNLAICSIRGKEFLTVRTPQQNKVTKRNTQTIIKAPRSMLRELNLLLIQLVFTQNRSLIVKRFNKTAYQIFYSRKLSICFLHIFGCKYFILNNKDNLEKFELEDETIGTECWAGTKSRLLVSVWYEDLTKPNSNIGTFTRYRYQDLMKL